MNQDVNFLPPELRPKPKKTKAEATPIEYLNPAVKDKVDLSSKTATAASKVADSFGNAKKNVQAPPQPNSTSRLANQAHQDLLQSIKRSQPAALSSKNMAASPPANKQIKPTPPVKAKKIEKNFDVPLTPIKPKRISIFQKLRQWLSQGKQEKLAKESAQLVAVSLPKNNQMELKPASRKEVNILGEGQAKKKSGWFDFIRKLLKRKNNIGIESGLAQDTGRIVSDEIAASGLPQTNLAKGFYSQRFDAKNLLFLSGTGIIASIMIIIWGYSYFNWYLTGSIDVSSDAQLQQKSKELSNLKQQVSDLGEFRSIILDVKKLLKNHTYWTQLFAYLEKYTLSGVYYESFNGDDTGEYTLAAHADSFDTFLKQVTLWQESEPYTNSIFFDSATLSRSVLKIKEEDGDGRGSSGINVVSVAFNIYLNINKSIFYYQDAKDAEL